MRMHPDLSEKHCGTIAAGLTEEVAHMETMTLFDAMDSQVFLDAAV